MGDVDGLLKIVSVSKQKLNQREKAQLPQFQEYTMVIDSKNRKLLPVDSAATGLLVMPSQDSFESSLQVGNETSPIKLPTNFGRIG